MWKLTVCISTKSESSNLGFITLYFHNDVRTRIGCIFGQVSSINIQNHIGVSNHNVLLSLQEMCRNKLRL